MACEERNNPHRKYQNQALHKPKVWYPTSSEENGEFQKNYQYSGLRLLYLQD